MRRALIFAIFPEAPIGGQPKNRPLASAGAVLFWAPWSFVVPKNQDVQRELKHVGEVVDLIGVHG
jgi:hypothetical protein